jgi:hypothetical protein
MKQNAFLCWPTKSKREKKLFGIFHQFDEEIQESIILMAMKDVLEHQAKTGHVREEILKGNNMVKVTKEYIDELYYHCMYNSGACWKGDPRKVTRELKMLKSELQQSTRQLRKTS